MTEEKNTLAELFAACWKDDALKARFMADPKAVLAEYDMPVPDGIDVKVVENADDCVHITLPAPPTGHMDLSDDELSDAAGGRGTLPRPNCEWVCLETSLHHFNACLDTQTVPKDCLSR